MIYARRDEQGRITALSLIQDGGHPESVDATSPEVAAFLAAAGGDLARTDLGLARVLEDLMQVLIDKSVIRFTDLPQAAQEKLLSRETMRRERRGINLLGDGETV